MADERHIDRVQYRTDEVKQLQKTDIRQELARVKRIPGTVS